MTDLILKSLWETISMVGLSTFFSIILGIPLAVLLVITADKGLCSHRFLNRFSGFLINALRSIPYIILTVLVMPLTKLIVGSTIGTLAAVVPLTIAGTLLVARVVEDALRIVKQGLIEVGLAFGATTPQIIRTIFFSEALPGIISGITTVIINLVGFSAMAGAVGGGGLGDLAIRYGYQRYDFSLMIIIVIILILMVQLIQSAGDRLSRYLTK